MSKNGGYGYGILRGKINEPYANVGVCITGDSCNLTGIYYTGGLVLFRVFDGSYINYFPDGTTLNILSSHFIISDLTLYEFDEEAWVVDGHEGTLCRRMTMAVGRSAAAHTDGKDYKKVLLNYAGLNNGGVVNGYSRVNEIILGTCGSGFGDASSVKPALSMGIVGSKYLKEGVLISKEFKNAYLDPSPDTIQKETVQYMRALSDAFISLTIDNSLYQKYILNINKKIPSAVPDVDLYIEYIRNGMVKEEDKLKLVSALSPLIHGMVTDAVPSKQSNDKINFEGMTEHLDIIRSGIQTLLNGFNSEKVPSLHISNIVTSFNSLADTMGVARLDTAVKADSNRSIAALIIAGNDGFKPAQIEVKLVSGEVVILPTKAPDLSDFNYSELIEILRYLMSIKGFDNRFNSLTTQITQELAVKTRLRNTSY